MIQNFNSDLDLTISRAISAPRSIVWDAWAIPENLEQWWVPAPAKCKVLKLDLIPGGSFVTHISENEGAFISHLSGCFLDIVEGKRIVFTNALVGGWRPAEEPFVTAIIMLKDHPVGTEYVAHVMHKNKADCLTHEDLGFYDGWGTCIDQLATNTEKKVLKGGN